MANIFTLENFDDFSEKINIDELYEKKKQNDLLKLELFKKILHRVHVRIKNTAKHRPNEKYVWFVVPEMIIGVPKYDQAGCIAYVMNALQDNGFSVRYFHPNTLFICWEEWVPSYVRNEIKKKTGRIVDEFGHFVEEKTDENEEEEPSQLQQIKNSKKYTPINSYKPSGKLVYSDELLNKIENKLTTQKS
jgi:hypothetical protein